MRKPIIAAAVALLSAGAAAAQDAPEAPTPFDELLFEGPECVRYDPAHERYLVSNINGGMTEADDNGYISAVPLAGEPTLKWIAGGAEGVTLNAPKGMELTEDRLVVADIDHVRVFDLATGEPVGAVKIEGAQFLNDVAVTPEGEIYVTDTGTQTKPGAIYRIGTDGEVTTVAEGAFLHRPNGIQVMPDGRIVTVTYGDDLVLTLSPEGEALEWTETGPGQLDGLLLGEDGSKLVSSWNGQSVIHVAPDGATQTVATGLVSPACFDIDLDHRRLLVPMVNANAVAVLSLPET